MSEKGMIREAFLKTVCESLEKHNLAADPCSMNVIMMGIMADGLIAALEKFDEVALINRRRHGL